MEIRLSDAGASHHVTLNFHGNQSGVITLPARSFSTFTMPAAQIRRSK